MRSRIWMSLPHSWSLWLLHSYHKTYSAYISQTFCSFLQPIFPYCVYKSCLTLKAKKWSVYLSPNTNLAPVSEYSRKVYRQKKNEISHRLCVTDKKHANTARLVAAILCGSRISCYALCGSRLNWPMSVGVPALFCHKCRLFPTV